MFERQATCQSITTPLFNLSSFVLTQAGGHGGREDSVTGSRQHFDSVYLDAPSTNGNV